VLVLVLLGTQFRRELGAVELGAVELNELGLVRLATWLVAGVPANTTHFAPPHFIWQSFVSAFPYRNF
jgi:hypothetical protein